ncbi:MAG: Xaa-Pro aminopeptidase [Eubacteriales bacterium]|nr:Xaa-Pro aminopeptidase [Eubacteriales bacterium]
MNYKERRHKLMEQLPEHSLTLLYAGGDVLRSADACFRFESNRNFYYLCGIEEQDAILALYKTPNKIEETLFIRDLNYDLEKWTGRYIRPEEAKAISEIEDVRFLSGFDTYFNYLRSRCGVNCFGLDGEHDPNGRHLFEGEEQAALLRQRYPMAEFVDVYPLICSMRLVKSPEEIELIRQAIAITDEALDNVLAHIGPEQYEYDFVAEFKYILNKYNATEMFETICASGENACVLHYISNADVAHDGELCLFDLGAKKDSYGADISRTYPVSGRYSPRQRQIYDIVLEGQDLIFSLARPGVTLRELNRALIDFYAKKLQEIGLIEKAEEVSKYYYHGVSHMFGLDTHDVGSMEWIKLEAGHVISNEPGLYIAEEGIGIRIENDLLITEDGCEDLCKDVKRLPEDIEAYIAAHNPRFQK